MITIANVLSEMWPNCSWSIDGDNYDTLVWSENNSVKKPTLKQIQDKRIKAEISLAWKQIRSKRDKLLSSSDWTQLKDTSLSKDKSAKWTAYRKELREIPQTYEDPDFVIWPEKPE